MFYVKTDISLTAQEKSYLNYTYNILVLSENEMTGFILEEWFKQATPDM